MHVTTATTPTRRRMRAGALLTAVVVAGLVLVGCANRSSETPPIEVETLTPTVSAAPTAAPEATTSPSAAPEPDASSPLDCWTLPVPDVAIAFTQTPEEFAAVNPGLVDSGAPSPCSLFASGAERDAAERWFDALVADGWQPDAAIEDDVYVSRNATSSAGAVAGYLVSKDGADPAAVTQFLTYQP